ncbi:MAG: hypothetical protein KGR26_16855, partial [Cyanobacteria bacterium REEB65]|nr:hypothetical protein [Cyanobacteria bacterium REEB65]
MIPVLTTAALLVDEALNGVSAILGKAGQRGLGRPQVREDQARGEHPVGISLKLIENARAAGLSKMRDELPLLFGAQLGPGVQPGLDRVK